MTETASPTSEQEPYRPPQFNVLREVKVDSPVHRLWAGTKIVTMAGLSVTLSYFPSWGAIGLVSALLLVTVLMARIPAGAWPRPPRWFWIVLILTGVLSTLAGGSPHLTVAGMKLGFGGIDGYSKFMMVGILLLLGALLLGWTTPLSEIAPALARLLSPLKLVRVPVDEASVAVALCVRSLPLLVGEIRTLLAARRLRPKAEYEGRGQLEWWLDEIIDVMVAAMAVSVRRAGELAEAITARGGTGRIAAHRPGPRRADALVLLLVAGLCFAATTFPA